MAMLLLTGAALLGSIFAARQVSQGYTAPGVMTSQALAVILCGTAFLAACVLPLLAPVSAVSDVAISFQ